MTGILAFTHAHAELSHDGAAGQASGGVDLSALGGAVSVDASASHGVPTTPGVLQPGETGADSWALYKS